MAELPGAVPQAQGFELQQDWLSLRWGGSTSPLPRDHREGWRTRGRRRRLADWHLLPAPNLFLVQVTFAPDPSV